MERLIEYLKWIGIVLLLVVVLSGLSYFGYWIWRLQHPDAPFWTWFFSGH